MTEAGPAEAPAGIQGCLAVPTVPPHPPRLLFLKPTAVHLGENRWPAEQGLSLRCASTSTDPEAPFSWSEEDISHLYGNTTILLAAEGEGASASPHVLLGGWSSRWPPRHGSCRFPSELRLIASIQVSSWGPWDPLRDPPP